MSYPYLEYQIIYQTKELYNYIDIDWDRYELKLYIRTNPSTRTLIPTSDLNLITRQYTPEILKIYTQTIYRYITPLTEGKGVVRFEYLYNNENLYLDININVFKQNLYPKIKIVPYLNNEEQLKYLNKENNVYRVKFFIYFSETDFVEIPADHPELSIRVSDKNILYDKDINGGYFTLLNPGTCRVNAYFPYALKQYYINEEFLIYETFLKNIWMKHFIGSYDFSLLQTNKKLKILIDSLMEFLDILNAYNNDIQHMNNIMQIKSKFLDVIGISLGFEKDNLYDSQNLSWVYEQLFRELISNLMDLIRLRGTKLSYELFFSALGYDIELLEYWFDADGNLIEMNYEDEALSSFYAFRYESSYHAYSSDGAPLEDVQTAHMDPRYLSDKENDYNFASKSKFARAIIEEKEGVYNPLAFSGEQRILIKKYLDWLKPNHIEYLQEVYRQNLTRFGPNPGDIGEELFSLLDSNSNFIIATLIDIVGYYINDDGNLIPLPPPSGLPEEPEDWPPGVWVPPPGSNPEQTYYGPYDPSTASGMAIERLKKTEESILFGSILEWNETLDIPVFYDSIYDYDNAEEDSYGLRYDIGRLLYDGELSTININEFSNKYTSYKLTHTNEETIEYLMSYFNISQYICQNIISIL